LSANDGPSYFNIDNLQGNVGIITNEIPSGDYFLTMKLQDSTFSTGVAFPIPGSLFTTRDVVIASPFLTGCSDWQSVANSLVQEEPFVYTVFASGYVNFWKYLREGEKILDSTVSIYKFVQLNTGNVFEGEDIYSYGQGTMPVLVNFYPFGPSGLYNGNGYFTNRSIAKGLIAGEMEPAYALFFKGYIYTTLDGVESNRTIYVDFIIEGEFTSSNEFEVVSDSYNCTIGDPDAYIPEDCYEWTIQNTSTFPIRWNGLHGNGVTIIGGIIQPGQYAKSFGNGGTYPVVRQSSLSAMGSITDGGIITYTGSPVTCPIL